jgi:hypothetical protein
MSIASSSPWASVNAVKPARSAKTKVCESLTQIPP